MRDPVGFKNNTIFKFQFILIISSFLYMLHVDIHILPLKIQRFTSPHGFSDDKE